MAVLPTLTLTGWVDDKNILMNKLFFYFVTTDYSQSVLYHGNLSSLKYLLHKNGDDLNSLIADVSSTLNKLYSRYFNTVDANANIKTINDDKTNKQYNYLVITIDATDEKGNSYSLEQSVNITNFDTNKLDELLTKIYS